MAEDSRRRRFAIRQFEAEDHVRVSRWLGFILRALLMAAATVAATSAILGQRSAFVTATASMVPAVAALLLNERWGRPQWATLVLLASMLGATTYSLIVGLGIHDTGVILYPTIIVVGSLVLERFAFGVLVALVVVSVGAVILLETSGIAASPFREYTDAADFVMIATILAIQGIGLDVLSGGLVRSLSRASQESRERRRAEEEVRRLNVELEERVRERTAELVAANEELEAFSYTVSHDLRAPLRATGSYARMLDEDFAADLSDDARQLLHRIISSSARMDLLIGALLDFARFGRQTPSRSRVATVSIVASVIETLAPPVDQRHIEWVVGELPDADADPVLLEQVYANLLGNAVKYTARCERARIEVGGAADGAITTFFVRDNGAGFDMRHADRLFKVFERLHRQDEFEGSGIGLATARRIVQRHGGTIWAEAEVGRGATFFFQLPALEAPVALSA